MPLQFKIGVAAEANNASKEIFKEELLEAHNRCRSLHPGTPPLKWSDDLAAKAQEWANRIASDERMIHAPAAKRTGQGENLAGCWGEPMTGTKATTQWYSEVHKYNYDDPYSCKGVGHFTQVIWKNSKEVGAAMAISATGWKYVVARYKPAGNMRGGNRMNVLPLQDDSES